MVLSFPTLQAGMSTLDLSTALLKKKNALLSHPEYVLENQFRK